MQPQASESLSSAKSGESARRDVLINRTLPVFLGLAVVLRFFATVAWLSYRNVRVLGSDAEDVAHTHDVIVGLDQLLLLMGEAESGQRGYLLTGDEIYLEPFETAKSHAPEVLEQLERLVESDPRHRRLLNAVKGHVLAKLSEVDKTIESFNAAGFSTAMEMVRSGRGRLEMEALRARLLEMRELESDHRQKSIAEVKLAERTAILSAVLIALVGIGLSIVLAGLIFRTQLERQRREWLQNGKRGLTVAASGEKTLLKLGEEVLGYLARYLDAHAGALLIGSGDFFERVATYGVPDGSEVPRAVRRGDGLLGEVAANGEIVRINNVPSGYLRVGSALGQDVPRQLIISPSTSDGGVNGILELGFIHPCKSHTEDLLREGASLLGAAIRSAQFRARLEELLEETQRQAEELQAQAEELRVTNEELEEQSRMLKENQAKLEQQQAELEQSNSHLEEQTQLLELQKDELEQARVAVQSKAEELERASRYKSDFLANMSHELRTPLNSSLILSKLLADNAEGNLSKEQVRYAQTIYSSGSDLLALINDILDLSKIEAGRMDILAEPVPLERMIEGLLRKFELIASQKGLKLEMHIDPGCPDVIETDRKRLDQVLANLVSNAVKFTEQGALRQREGHRLGGMAAGVAAHRGGRSATRQSHFVGRCLRWTKQAPFRNPA